MTRKTRPYVHHPMGSVQVMQQAEVHHILHSTGAQAKLTIGQPNDKYEQEADRVADQVMRMPDPKLQRQPENEEEEETLQTNPLVDNITPVIQRQEEPPEEDEEAQAKEDGGSATSVSTSVESGINTIRSGGSALSESTRSFFEPRFGRDFGGVRIHTDSNANHLALSVNSKAFTVGQNVVFGTGQYSPGSRTGRSLLAHELTHVIQQSYLSKTQKNQMPQVQRIVEVRPPGRSESSAFDSRDDLIVRLNRQSPAIQYDFVRRELRYNIINVDAFTDFDRKMRVFIDLNKVLPLRLVTSAALVADPGTPFMPLLVDSFVLGYLDLDDLLACDNHSFRMRLIHILTERNQSRNYARRIGGSFSITEFDRVHRAGHDAQAEYLRDFIGDPTIRFIFNETLPNGVVLIGFRSNEGYIVYERFLHGRRRLRGGEVFVIARDGRRLTIEQLMARRAAAPNVP